MPKGVEYIMPAGKRFRQLIHPNYTLPILGTVNAYCALLARDAGAKTIYLSGAGVANASFGMPDLGMTTATDVLEDAQRISYACDLPLLVDIDTGFGHVFNIERTIKLLERAGVAAVHIEDQIAAKRCGHRPNKTLVSSEEMCDRVKSAVDARLNQDFVIMARTDAYGVEGFEAAVARANAYVSAGADMIFAEAMQNIEEYARFCEQVRVPVLANITEFGKTPLFSRSELETAGVAMALYPLSAFRAMSKAASLTYKTILEQGSQQERVPDMQTRSELYDTLGYYRFEEVMDSFKEEQS